MQSQFCCKGLSFFFFFQNSFDVNHIWKSCMEWWKNVQNWAHTLWFVQLKTIAWIISMQSRAQWVLVFFFMNFLVLFTESNKRVRWANNTNNAEEIAKILHGLHTHNEQMKFFCIFYLLLFFFFYIRNPFKPFVFKVPLLLLLQFGNKSMQWQLCQWFILSSLWLKSSASKQTEALMVHRKRNAFYDCHITYGATARMQLNFTWMIRHFESKKDLLTLKWDDVPILNQWFNRQNQWLNYFRYSTKHIYKSKKCN